MADVVLFDLFGVIARDQSARGRERLVALSGVDAPEFWDAYWTLRPGYDRGEVTGARYWRLMAERLGAGFDDGRIDDLIELDIASWSAVDDEMVALVEELAAAGRRIALLSNIPEDLAAHYEGRHGWLRHFQVRAFSCRIGRAKPSPGAYRWCHAALDLEPDRILVVDDREENIRAADGLGMRSHLFTTAARLRAALA